MILHSIWRDPWLFDLIRDPGEAHNLYETSAGDIAGKRLKTILDKLLAERSLWCH
jgi:hypothetical protein